MIWLDDTTGAVEAIPHTRHIKGNFVFRISFRGQTSNLWALDKDDGSSNYNQTDNVLLYGAIKDRDGRDRAASGNLILYPDVALFPGTSNRPAMSIQISGYATDSFIDNTVVLRSDSGAGGFYACTSKITPTTTEGEVDVGEGDGDGGGNVGGTGGGGHPHFAANTFIMPNGTLSVTGRAFPQHGCSQAKTLTFKDWQGEGFDAGTTLSNAALTPADLVAMARAKLPLLRLLQSNTE